MQMVELKQQSGCRRFAVGAGSWIDSVSLEPPDEIWTIFSQFTSERL